MNASVRGDGWFCLANSSNSASDSADKSFGFIGSDGLGSRKLGNTGPEIIIGIHQSLRERGFIFTTISTSSKNLSFT